jgi:hypothetical protein
VTGEEEAHVWFECSKQSVSKSKQGFNQREGDRICFEMSTSPEDDNFEAFNLEVDCTYTADELQVGAHIPVVALPLPTLLALPPIPLAACPC